MLKVVACLLVVVAISGHLQTANGLAHLRTRRAAVPAPVPAVVATPASAESDGVTVTEDEPATVMAEIKSEADEIGEDGSNDDSALMDGEDGRTTTAPATIMVEAEIIGATQPVTESKPDTSVESIHDHFSRFTKPMELLPTHSLAEVKSNTGSESTSGVKKDEEEGEGKGSNPTYILPVDPFNYFPFFNGFSNVNPFSQFYPPPPYLYPQYTNYMHRYANHGVGHPPAYPQPGAYGGAFGHHAAGHGSFPYNYPHPNPHMHYPFGAYKLDVSGPDVRTGTNDPPPFPQFAEMTAEIKLITPEIIPKSNAAEADAEEETAPITVQLETSADESDSDETTDEVEFADESEDGSEMTDAVEFNDAADETDGMTDEVEFADEESDSDGMTDEVEFQDNETDGDQLTDEIEFQNDEEEVDSQQDEEGNVYNAFDVEYQK